MVGNAFLATQNTRKTEHEQEETSSMWFQHDGAPAHYRIDVRLHLNATYGQQGIGRGGPVLWPALSPDLNCLDYFLWGYVKSLVCETPINSAEDLASHIAAAAGEVRDAYLQTLPL
ncbi:hypothetical protein AVEN_177952-1 [Araneus ventricosus]|uniref:Tc1-like transposase DDE domain-containing protein n=1 Tax=Araneus ventricosus TaxID=182803 RepID=A0A4Y2TZN3_ARAVE|nr:hypothetical protein AVEN_193698-1 [Araneus ventricosus]GBO06181.1 hypothetical protein AVEN_177952-1 [Araneus ventricosus]